MDLKPISIKVPTETLAQIDALAKASGLSRTAMLLKPFTSPESPAATAQAVIETAERRGFPKAPKPKVREPIGYSAATGEPIYERQAIQKVKK
jgi:hypothetical protein